MTSPIVVNVELTEVLTASLCSHLAVEFFRHIVYQRQQVPFPYKQLKSVLDKRELGRRLGHEEFLEESSTTNAVRSYQLVQADHEYRKVKGLFESMQKTFQNLSDEINFEDGRVEEVAMILGATPFSPRDVYRLQFPPLLFGHLENKHPYQNSLLQLFRCLISSEDLHSIFSQPLSPTNMFLLLRKGCNSVATSGFIPKERFSIPSCGKHAVIRLIPPTVIPKCICGGSNIYQDLGAVAEDMVEESNHSRNLDEPQILHWFEALQAMKGFKDVKINGTHASTIWLQSR